MNTANLITFVTAVIALQLIPGPDMMLVIGRGLAQGTKHSLSCVFGFAAAGFVQAPLLALGVASIFQTSPLAYSLLRNLGALYLLYFGLRTIFAAGILVEKRGDAITTAKASFRQGFIQNLLNPKVLIFQLAFLPQFIRSEAGFLALQICLLVAIQKTIGIVFNGSIAVCSGYVGRFTGGFPGLIRWQQRLVGSLIVGLGIYMLTDSNRKT